MSNRPTPISVARRVVPLLWGVAGMVFGYWYAQFISKIGWNAIELIIAQHLLNHGSYVTSLDYQSSIAWRPVFPTLLVTGVRVFTESPLEVYRTVCGLAFAAIGASSYLLGKRLWGTLAGHSAAVLALACPAITTYLIHHIHSYSHLGLMVVLAPALLVAMNLLREDLNEEERSRRTYIVCGVLWGLVYLCRSELLLYVLIYFAAQAIVHRRTAVKWHRLAWAVVPFLLLFLAYNTYADFVCKRDGILIRKPIYGMYMSQGWVDPAPGGNPDIEGDGYRYALQLYGDPLDHKESLVRAIRANPSAFSRRVRLNVANFYRHYWEDTFFPRVYAVMALAALLLYAVRQFRGSEKNPLVVPTLLLFCLASHCILIFHVDPRYLTITILPLVFLAAYAASSVTELIPRTSYRWAASAAVVVLLLLQGKRQWSVVSNHAPRNEAGPIAMRSLAEHFNSLKLKRSTQGNREPHIFFEFPTQSPIEPEDQFLLAYFTDTAWVNGGAEGPFPRGKFYSFKDSPIDYRYVPEEKIGDPRLLHGMRIISDCQNPILGKYYLLQAKPR